MLDENYGCGPECRVCHRPRVDTESELCAECAVEPHSVALTPMRDATEHLWILGPKRILRVETGLADDRSEADLTRVSVVDRYPSPCRGDVLCAPCVRKFAITGYLNPDGPFCQPYPCEHVARFLAERRPETNLDPVHVIGPSAQRLEAGAYDESYFQTEGDKSLWREYQRVIRKINKLAPDA